MKYCRGDIGVVIEKGYVGVIGIVINAAKFYGYPTLLHFLFRRNLLCSLVVIASGYFDNQHYITYRDLRLILHL